MELFLVLIFILLRFYMFGDDDVKKQASEFSLFWDNNIHQFDSLSALQNMD